MSSSNLQPGRLERAAHARRQAVEDAGLGLQGALDTIGREFVAARIRALKAYERAAPLTPADDPAKQAKAEAALTKAIAAAQTAFEEATESARVAYRLDAEAAHADYQAALDTQSESEV